MANTELVPSFDTLRQVASHLGSDGFLVAELVIGRIVGSIEYDVTGATCEWFPDGACCRYDIHGRYPKGLRSLMLMGMEPYNARGSKWNNDTGE